MAKKRGGKGRYVTMPAICGRVLGVDVYRGFGPLGDLARISRADIYDQHLNPTGTQRDLSPKHARQAYEYVKTRDVAFWPEVFLCLRSPEVMLFTPAQMNPSMGNIRIDLSMVENSDKIAISRVDGNHRLHYADGVHEGYPAIDREVSFCLAHNLTLEQEITLFRDINDNQRRMNTSHLDNIQSRLTPEQRLKREQPALYIAETLGKDNESPFYDRVYEGGRRPPECFMPLRTLKTGIQYMFSQPSKLTELPDVDAQYKVIRNYFEAVKRWQPESWKNPKKYLVLRGAGFWGICFIGMSVIDRVLSQGKYSSDAMYRVLQSGYDWDWSNKGDFMGFSGRGGAVKIRDQVVKELEDPSGVSVRDLAKKIIGS